MNAMMAGMFPTMVVLMMGRDMRAMEPTQLLYWATMSAGVIVGFFTAYPVNVWMVSRNLKHGLMHAERTPPSVAGRGGHGVAADGAQAHPAAGTKGG